MVEGGTASGCWRPLCKFHLPPCSIVVIVQLLILVRLFATPWTVAHQALCPWDLLGKNTEVSCHLLLQGSSQSKDRTYTSCISCTGRRILHH